MVEFKILNVDREWITKVLKKHGAELIFNGEIVTEYFDRETDNFIKDGKRLRLRNKADTTRLAFRDSYNEDRLGEVDEVEIEVNDIENTRKLLKSIGFESFKRFKKYRYDYKVGNSFISFDNYREDLKYIPEFLTIEAPMESIAFKWAERFGYQRKDCKVITVTELINKYP